MTRHDEPLPPDPVDGRDEQADLGLGQERRSEFVLADGTPAAHRHSALALALRSPYGGKGIREFEPWRRLPERLSFQAHAEYRELLDALERVTAELGKRVGALDPDEAAAGAHFKANLVLAKHNRPRPGR